MNPGGGLSKLGTRVFFPEFLDIGPFMAISASKTSTKYRLFAVVNHSGSLNSGHYVAHSRRLLSNKEHHVPDNSTTKGLPTRGDWFYFSDSNFHKVDNPDKTQPYLLFYEQVS